MRSRSRALDHADHSFIRISVGGVRDESARIEKSVALARAVLKRL